jgi:hypothetical protein
MSTSLQINNVIFKVTELIHKQTWNKIYDQALCPLHKNLVLNSGSTVNANDGGITMCSYLLWNL